MSSDRLRNWTQIAEIISGLAVLVTLVILVIEVRENTAVTRMSAYQEELDRANEWRYNVASNADQRYVYQQFTEGSVEKLDEDQVFLLRMVLNSLFSQRESSYFAMTNGFLGNSEWERMFRPTCNAHSLVIQTPEIWDRIASTLTPEFVGLLQSEC